MAPVMPISLISTLLKKGGIGVIPTDTVYGIVARAFDEQAVGRLYALRRSTLRKPFIILVSSVRELAAFGCKPNAAVSRFLKTVWPGKVSVILPCHREKFAYLHLGTGTLAFRLPRSKALITLLKKTGPLVAPSANREGNRPARTIAEAKKYFGSAVDIYVRGIVRVTPSTLVSMRGPTPTVIRQGSVKI